MKAEDIWAKTFIYLLLIFINPVRYLSQHLFIHPQYIPGKNLINLRCAEASLFKCVHKQRHTGSIRQLIMRLDPVKISSKTEAVNPSHLHNVLRMLYNRVNRTIGSLAIRNVGQKCRAKIKTCHTAFFRQKADHIIRQVPHPAADGTGVGMAGDKRFF